METILLPSPDDGNSEYNTVKENSVDKKTSGINLMQKFANQALKFKCQDANIICRGRMSG